MTGSSDEERSGGSGVKQSPNQSGRRAESTTMRHTHAAWLIVEGEHLESTQSRLGHSSIQVTIDRYEHLMDDLDERTAARLDAIA